ncbi:hypothetical protein QR46_2301 [Giardia duodenalis assemblage B]|uniref:Uncharacterized protein n=3 Tax=Giardia intestinalis TaxID=5741 RepID=A0A132NUG6_GIAIN|nr:Hypothetical protein GL50581_2952 [Giardia intestinalis ATCC 50581]ESU45239.1 Hypothetical protein GSB_11342 [Giardia intestinalis]KWX13716.1 hypothetical protein QR46_2301 [Giardia intestinalis assemblage B]
MTSQFTQSQIDAKMNEIRRANATAKLIPTSALRQWAIELLSGTHSSLTNPPASVSVEPLLQDEEDLGEDATEFGDVVELKGHKFVICNGLVIPKDLLEDKVLPMIDSYMKEHGITLDQVFNEMMQ